MSEQKVLVFDIETSPLITYSWGIRDQYLGTDQIKNDWYVIAWAAKWLGAPASKTLYLDQRAAKDKEDDRGILTPLWCLLDEADIVITQNGKNFDSKKLNARFIMHGMTPPKPYKHLDTYQIARSAAKFTSNKLEYLTDKLCTKYRKLKHKKFPGLSLWKECMKGNPAAWAEMKKYNVHDVLSTEELYMKLRAWAPQNAPGIYTGPRVCQACGGTDLRLMGHQYTRTARYQQMLCKKCGSWTRGGREALA